MPPPELRGFILQPAVAVTVLAGFAHHHLVVRRATWGWSSVLGAGWAGRMGIVAGRPGVP